ncbi:hypothetical protein CsatB_000991 [Cannabis sativa]
MILKEKPLIGVEFWVISSLKLVEIVERVNQFVISHEFEGLAVYCTCLSHTRPCRLGLPVDVFCILGFCRLDRHIKVTCNVLQRLLRDPKTFVIFWNGL